MCSIFLDVGFWGVWFSMCKHCDNARNNHFRCFFGRLRYNRYMYLHMQGLLGLSRWTNIEPTVGNNVGPMNKITSFVKVVPSLAQRMSTIWDIFKQNCDLILSAWVAVVREREREREREQLNLGGIYNELSLALWFYCKY